MRQARKAAEEKLAEAKELEKQWQSNQAEMDLALKVHLQISKFINYSHFRHLRCIRN